MKCHHVLCYHCLQMLIHDYHKTTLVHKPKTHKINTQAGKKIININENKSDKGNEEDGRNRSIYT